MLFSHVTPSVSPKTQKNYVTSHNSWKKIIYKLPWITTTRIGTLNSLIGLFNRCIPTVIL